MSQYPRAEETAREHHVTRVLQVPEFSLGPRTTTRIVPGRDLTLSFSKMEPHTEGAVHRHPHEQMIYVLSGNIDILLDGKLYGLAKGEVMWIPSNAEHAGMTQEEPCEMLEIFTPARKDFEEKLAQAKAERGR